MPNNPSPDQVNPVTLPKHVPARFRNQARVAATSGRWVPSKYKAPVDTRHLMNKKEFFKRYIKNKPRNIYTNDNAMTGISDDNATSDSLSPATSRKTFV